MVSPTPGERSRATALRCFGRLLREIPRTAMEQLFGQPQVQRRYVYWTRDRRGNWVLHIPMSRERA